MSQIEYDKALEDQEMNDTARAIIYYRKALQKAKAHKTLPQSKEDGEMENNWMETVLEWYDKSILSDPFFELSRTFKGDYLSESKRYDEAQSAFDEACAAIGCFGSFFRRGLFFYKTLEQNEKAMEDYSKAIQILEGMSEKDLRASYNDDHLHWVSNVYYHRADLQDCRKMELSDYSKAITMFECDNYYFLRGELYRVNFKDFEKAIHDYSKAIDFDPEWPWYYARRGFCFLELKEFDKALSDYDRAIKIVGDNFNADKNYSLFFNERGEILYELGDFSGAVSSYTKAIQIYPDEPDGDAYRNRGMVYRELNENDKAIQDYSKYIELRPDFFASYYARGNTYADLPQYYEQAERDFEKALECELDDEDKTLIHSEMSDLYLNQRLREKAKQAADRAIECSPHLYRGYEKRGLVYYTFLEFEAAIADFTRSIELQPEEKMEDSVDELQKATSFVHRGQCYRHSGRGEEAMKDYLKAVEIDPKYSQAHALVGQAYLDLNPPRYEDAFAAFTRGIEVGDPKRGGSYGIAKACAFRGRLYYNANNFEKALEDFSRAISAAQTRDRDFRDLAEPLRCRGMTYMWLGKNEDARRDFEEMVRLFPNKLRGPLGIAQLLRREEQYEEAVKILDKAIANLECDPELGFSLYNHRGLCFLKMKKYEKAKSDFLKALTHSSTSNNVLVNQSDTNSLLFLAELFYELNEIEEGEKFFKKAIETGGNLREVYRKCMELHREHDPERALEDYSRIISLDEVEKAALGDIVDPKSTHGYSTKDWDKAYEELKGNIRKVDCWYPFAKDAAPEEVVQMEIRENREFSEILSRPEMKKVITVFRCLGRGAFGAAYLCHFKDVRGIFVMKLFLESVRVKKNQKNREDDRLRSWTRTRSKEDLRIPYDRNVVSVLYSSEKPEWLDVSELPDYRKFWRRRIRSYRSKLRKLDSDPPGPANKKKNEASSVIATGMVIMRYHRKDLMKYCIQRKRAKVPFEDLEVCYMLIGLLRGILHFHRHRIVHRDLHLGNVFVDEVFGRVFIGDFGCTLDLRDNPTGFKVPPDHEILFTYAETEDSNVRGTGSSEANEEEDGEDDNADDDDPLFIRIGGYPLHLAPEIVDFDVKKKDQLGGDQEDQETGVGCFLDYEKCDLFSVGMIGYKLVTLRIGRNETGAFGNFFNPFFRSRRKKVRNRSMEELITEGAVCHEKLLEFIVKLLEVDLEKRISVDFAVKQMESLIDFFETKGKDMKGK